MGYIFFYKNKIGIMYDTLKSLDVNLARNRCIIDNFGCIDASVSCIFVSILTIFSKLLLNLHPYKQI